jgi:hypothetical protein
MASALREARLRPEFVALYPGLTAETWLPAREVAEHIIAIVRHERGRLGQHGRILAEDHFEFRGGESADRRQNRNERWEDRAAE